MFIELSSYSILKYTARNSYTCAQVKCGGGGGGGVVPLNIA